ncbi:unnamed protein product [Absidia cylindrospora]
MHFLFFVIFFQHHALRYEFSTQSSRRNEERGKKRQDTIEEPYNVSLLISNMYQRTFDLPRKRYSFDNLSLPSITQSSSSTSRDNKQPDPYRLFQQRQQQKYRETTQPDVSAQLFSSTSQSSSPPSSSLSSSPLPSPSPPSTCNTANDNTSTSLDDLLGRLEALDLDNPSPTLPVKPSPTYQLRNKIIDTGRLALQAQNALDDTGYFEEDFDSLYAKTALPKPKGVEDLTDEENALVDSVLNQRQSGLVSQFKTAMVEFKDVNKLLPETWLNDEIINFYMVLLMDRATSSRSDSLPSVHCYNTFFCSTLRDQGYDKVKRWTKKVDIFSKRLLLIPINRSYHWTLGVIDLAKKQVLVYDSLNGRHHGPTLKLFLQYLEWEHMDKKKTAYDTSGWQTIMPSGIPQQQNSSDCGVFACTFAERLARNHEFDFGQDDMVSIRRRMVLDIMRKKLSI